MKPSDPQQLISRQSLVQNVLWNVLGIAAPIFVALFAIPQLIHRMGVNRFGVLTLAWVVVGYFGLFDVGLGRTLTKLAAEFLGQQREEEVPELFWTSMALTTVLGLLGMLTLILLTPWLVYHALKIPAAIAPGSLRSFYLLSLSIPVVIWTAALRGFLEAHQRFALVNAVRIPLGIFTYAGPLLVLPFSVSLFPTIAVLTGGRLVAGAIYGILCLRVDPQLRKRVVITTDKMMPLLRFGGWMSVSNVVSPLMVIADRFVIGALLSMAAVTFYATPFEIVTKVLVIPSAIVGVLFPAFSTGYSHEPERTARLFFKGTKYIFLILFPVLLAIVVFSREGLEMWLGANFASHSVRVLEWLAAGVLLNGLAQVPFALIQGIGRPDLTAKLHMAELPAYALLLWLLIRTMGIEGAAIAWTLRAGVDALVLFALSHRLLGTEKAPGRRAAIVAAAALGLMLPGALLPHFLLKAIYFAGILLAFAFVGWFWLLSPEERALLERCWRTAEVSS